MTLLTFYYSFTKLNRTQSNAWFPPGKLLRVIAFPELTDQHPPNNTACCVAAVRHVASALTAQRFRHTAAAGARRETDCGETV